MLDKLYVFKEVYEQNSFSHAAQKLYITQSAVSKIIKSLEDELTTQLFERNGVHGIIATKQADILYKKSLKLIHEWHNTINLVQNTQSHISECSIGFSQTVSDCYFAKIATDFISKFPNINFHFITANSEEILSMVINNELDFGYIEKPLNSKKLIKEEIFNDQMVLVENKKSNVWLNREHESGVRFFNDLYLFNNPNNYQQIIINNSSLIKEIIKDNIGNTIMSKKSVDTNMKYKELDSTFNRKIFVIHDKLHSTHLLILNELNKLLKSIS